ncbi:MAG TPA: hypothetical protein VIV40_31175 [Kofleriaceae bacterium]
MSRVVALVACTTLVTGCFGYNSSAKKWAYVGDTVFIVGGGGAIAGDILTHEKCEGLNCEFDPPFGGAAVAGALLVTAGIVGLIVNATRSEVKTSR